MINMALEYKKKNIFWNVLYVSHFCMDTLILYAKSINIYVHVYSK